MQNLIVVNNPQSWPLEIPGVEIVSSRAYLTNPAYGSDLQARVFNLCRSYRYQSNGYYVSLLAAARGHKPLPSISTIQDMKSPFIVKYESADLDDLIQKSLSAIQSDEFTLSIYFGRNMAKRYDRLALNLFNLFPSPLLRAEFTKDKVWRLQTLSPIPADQVPKAHHEFVVEVAREHFSGRGRGAGRARKKPRFDLALLVNPEEPNPPSDEVALRKFIRAFERKGIAVEELGRQDFGRLAEFDALFIRETTAINHHTFRFARRAAADGLVVIDDPESILRCTNKVFLAELLDHHGVPHPRTLIVHKDNIDEVKKVVGLPCILKQPDSSFSQGVSKVDTEEALHLEVEKLLEKSDLIIAQEFLPTEFDWRIGIIDEKPFYACRYFMARSHWQIIKHDGEGSQRYGRVEAVPVEIVPAPVIRTALKAANLIGDGLYGVDLKQIGRECYIIEVNDNPTIEATCEDGTLKDALYDRVAEVFLDRLEARKEGRA